MCEKVLEGHVRQLEGNVNALSLLRGTAYGTEVFDISNYENEMRGALIISSSKRLHSSFVPECHPYAFVSVGCRLSLCTSTHHHSRSRLLVTLLLPRQASLASALTATSSSVQATTTRYVSGTPKPGQTHTFSRVYVCFHACAHRFEPFIT